LSLYYTNDPADQVNTVSKYGLLPKATTEISIFPNIRRTPQNDQRVKKTQENIASKSAGDGRSKEGNHTGKTGIAKKRCDKLPHLFFVCTAL